MSERDDLDKLTEALNAAGRTERPSAKKKEAILEAVLSKAGGGGGGSPGGRRRPMLWLGALAMLVAVGAWQFAARGGPEDLEAPQRPVSTPPPVAAAAQPPSPLPVEQAVNETAPVARVDPSPPTEAPAKAPPAPRPREEEDDLLAREVQLLDQARAALPSDPARALSLLEQHQRRFARGALAVEAELVKIEALLRSGRRGQAERTAKRLIAEGPDSPVAARARRLLEEAP